MSRAKVMQQVHKERTITLLVNVCLDSPLHGPQQCSQCVVITHVLQAFMTDVFGYEVVHLSKNEVCIEQHE